MACPNAVRLKIIRAKQHLQALGPEIQQYFSQNPAEVVADDRSDPNGRALIKFDIKIPVPASVPLIIGDAL